MNAADLRLDLLASRDFSGRATNQPARLFAPELSYGRHRGPALAGSRQAAVLLLAYPHQGAWFIPLTVRNANLPDHAGQVSLPGGAVEKGESSQACALREFEEELGVSCRHSQVLGRLSSLWVFVSNFEVTPWVAVASQRPELRPNAAEVSEVLEFPVAALLDPAARGRHVVTRQSLQFRAPHFSCGGHKIWGATSLILAEFAALLADLA